MVELLKVLFVSFFALTLNQGGGGDGVVHVQKCNLFGILIPKNDSFVG